MNSSGIKRGLAATAISALAVTGLPALATTAGAASGDNFTVTYTGPALNAGDEGALVIIRAEDDEIDPTRLELTSTSDAEGGSQNNGDQTVEIVDVSDAIDDPADGDYEFFEVRIKTTTNPIGGTATFRLFEDDNEPLPDDDEVLQASEARQTVSISTAGPLASIDVSPATQSSPEGIESGAYTVTLKDAAGRTTRLEAGDFLNITAAGVTITETGPDTSATPGEDQDKMITSDEIVRGTDTFTGSSASDDSYDILVEDDADDTIEDTAVLNVTEAADLDENNINIVTEADTWSDYGDDDAGTTFVRVDQNTIRFDFKTDPAQPGANVQLAVDGTDADPGDPLDGNGVTFAGQKTAVYTTTLDADGNGSITVTADAATVQENNRFTVNINGFDQTIVFDRADATSIDGESATYFCQDDADCTVTAVVKDQFGNPVTSGEVEARRIAPGQNIDAAPQRKPVGPDGTVDFTFADANPVDGGSDTVQFQYFLDSFDNTAELTDASTKIKYSATGQGSDFVVSLDGENTESNTYEPGDASIIPLFDTVVSDVVEPDDEDAVISITGGEQDQKVTLSVDNGALILAPTETMLSQGSSSVDATLDGAGTLATAALPNGYRVIGTTSGLVTLTVDSAGRTETAQLTVEAQDDPASARNVTLTAPASVPSGTNQITFVAVITDAFGNPVPGVENGDFNKQVTGPAQYQDGDAVSDANGQPDLNVRVDNDATGDVTLMINGDNGTGQFGAQADRQHSYSNTEDGKGLSASSDEATATTTVEAAQVPPVNAALTLKGKQNGAKDDRLFANAINKTEGADVTLYRQRANGSWKQVATGVMNEKGNHRFRVNDRNGTEKTRYKAVVEATEQTRKGKGFKIVR